MHRKQAIKQNPTTRGSLQAEQTAVRGLAQSLYSFSETHFKDFSRNQTDFFYKTQNFTLKPFIPKISKSTPRVYINFLQHKF